MLVAGIDIGGTQLRAAVFDENYSMISSVKYPNDPTRTAEENLLPLMDFLNGYAGQLSGVGIGTPGPIDRKKGMLRNPPNLIGWDHFEIVRFVEEKIKLPARLNIDGNVAGLAEAILGAGRGCASVAFVGVSTGVGGAFICNGKIINGAHDNCAEIWNMIVNDDEHRHKNANAGSLNEQASGSGLSCFASERYGRMMDARELFERCEAGDALAAEIIDHAADVLARGLANISCTLDPETIIVGGSVAIHHWRFVERAAQIAAGYINYEGGLDVRPAAFADDAGLIGAALLMAE